LSNDIRKNLQEPLAEFAYCWRESEGHDINVRAEVRTGDTTAAQRSGANQETTAHSRDTRILVSPAHFRIGPGHVGPPSEHSSWTRFTLWWTTGAAHTSH